MKIDILCVGKIKEKYFTDALAEYAKRLRRYCDINVIQTPDEPAPENLSEARRLQVMEAEGERLLKHIGPDTFTIALAIRGKRLSSEQLADLIQDKMVHGTERLCFVIGGSLGLSPAVLDRADYSLSFSDFTFPHQLMRVILLEQIYRSFRIMRGEPYHK